MLHKVFSAIFQGVQDRGDGGFLYVRGDDAVYMFTNELQGRDELKQTLEDLKCNEDSKKVFYVVEERDDKMHLIAYTKERVFGQIAELIADKKKVE